MMLPLILSASCLAFQGPYSTPMLAPQPVRLELTPALDGTISKEEWDPFGPQTFLQWEPGKLYIGSQAAAGKDLVLSIDGKGDGWLVGRDNLEFRVSVKDGKAIVTVRELDATVVSAPVWRERKDLEAASTAVAGTQGDQTTIEAVFDDAGLGVLPRKPQTMMLRLDSVDSTADSAPYIPRTCMAVRFDDHRSVALPRGMDSGVEARFRSVIPGENLSLRMTFHGSNALGVKTIELRTLGQAENSANRMSLLFPNFDNKGRAFVDYPTKIDPTATLGYRIVSGALTFKDGAPASIEASYRIAPLMDFSLIKTEFDRLPEDNVIRIYYVLEVYTHLPSEGLVRVEPPAGWQIVKGDGQKFKLLGFQTAEAHQVALHLPADAHGTFPIKFSGQTKDRTVTQTCYLTIR